MAKGYQDWGVNTEALSYQNTDLGELANKLGYGESASRSGKLVYFETFEVDYNGWYTGTSGASSTVTHKNTYKHSSPGCVELITGSGSNDYANINNKIPYLGSRTHGLGAYIKIPSSLSELYLYARLVTGTLEYKPTIRVNRSPKEIQVRTTAGAFQAIDITQNLSTLTEAPFHFIKISWDLSTGKYIKAQVNKDVIDISDISMEVEAVVDTDFTRISVECDGDGTLGMTALIDSIYYTIDEPQAQ